MRIFPSLFRIPATTIVIVPLSPRSARQVTPRQFTLVLAVSPELGDHFRNPRNVGELAPPAITVEVSNPVCGDILRLSVLMEQGRVAGVGYKVRGCAASIASGSALTVLLAGRDRTELSSITSQTVEGAVGGLSNESKHAAALCVDAVRAILKLT